MHRQTKATNIPPAVKKRVEERDSIDGCPCCIFCGRPHGRGELHYIPRSAGGLGIEENLLTGCDLCHRKFDGPERKQMMPRAREYLQSMYPDWDEAKLVYHKYGEVI